MSWIRLSTPRSRYSFGTFFHFTYFLCVPYPRPDDNRETCSVFAIVLTSARMLATLLLPVSVHSNGLSAVLPVSQCCHFIYFSRKGGGSLGGWFNKENTHKYFVWIMKHFSVMVILVGAFATPEPCICLCMDSRPSLFSYKTQANFTASALHNLMRNWRFFFNFRKLSCYVDL